MGFLRTILLGGFTPLREGNEVRLTTIGKDNTITIGAGFVKLFLVDFGLWDDYITCLYPK